MSFGKSKERQQQRERERERSRRAKTRSVDSANISFAVLHRYLAAMDPETAFAFPWESF